MKTIMARQVTLLKLMLVLLVAFIGVGVREAHAATITFNSLPGANDDAVSTYSESGYQVNSASGAWRAGHFFGNPVPSWFTISPSASVEVLRAGGGLFTFASADAIGHNGQLDYQVTGYLAAAQVYTFSGSATAGVFTTVTNLSFASALVDRLVITVGSPGGSSRNIDNIVVNDATAVADLSITKTDGVSSVTAGGSLTYTITASNAGPDAATGATVADTFPASLTGSWTCVGAGGGTCTAAGSGNINDTVNLPAGGSVTYTVSATVSPAATGTLSNTATVSSATTDPSPGNNSATDTDTIIQSADLSITKTDGVTTATAGGSVTYTITASNAGPSNASGATVADTFPASLTGTWTCVGAGGGTCTAAGSGNINDTVNLPAGGSVTYTVSAAVSPAATGTLSNTATVSSAITDPSPGNNSATDTDTINQSADLAITKTDGVSNVAAGGSVTYTITASNAGPSHVMGATVADTLPASLTGATWTCVGAGGGTCTASGSGNINGTVNLPAGGSVTYTVSATVSPAATGTLSNTATVSSAATDPSPGNNSATDTDTIGQSGDLSVTLTGPAGTVVAGNTVVYTLVVGNSGPSNATGAAVTSTLTPAPTSVNWTCVGSGGASCPASGSGNINGTADVPSGGSVSYTITAVIPASAATGTLDASASVAAPAGYTDTAPINNTATASNALEARVVTPVPSLSVWALILLSLGLLAVGRTTWHRREG